VIVPEPRQAHTAKAPALNTTHLEVADILRRFGPSYAQTHAMSPFEQRLIDDLITCRTARLGYVGGLTSAIWSAALNAVLSDKLTTRAAIGIVPNVRPSPRCDGSRPDGRSFYPHPIFTPCSPYRMN
jgi:hypothetical protein